MPGKDLTLSKCLTGSLLISAPGRGEHPLEECVVYVYEHSPQLGAQGVVINRQSGVTVEVLLERMKMATGLSSLKSPLYHGGLSDENGIIMLHSGDWYSANTRPISSEISVSSDTFMLEKLVSGDEPDNWLMCAGKCAWEPGELDKEVDNNLWLTVPAPSDLVFSPLSSVKQWRAALDYCTKRTVDSWF